MIDRYHDLLSFEAERENNLLDCVDGCSVERGLTGLEKPRVADGKTEPVQQTFEGRGPAVHRRRLHDFGSEPAPAAPAEPSCHHASPTPPVSAAQQHRARLAPPNFTALSAMPRRVD